VEINIEQTMKDYDEICNQIKELEQQKEHLKIRVKLFMNLNNKELIERDDGSKWVYKEIKGRKTLAKDLVESNLKDGVTLDDCYKEGTSKKDIRFYSASQLQMSKQVKSNESN